MRSTWALLVTQMMGTSLLVANPLSTGCMRLGWVKVAGISGAISRTLDGRIWVHPNGRLYYKAKADQPILDALLIDPDEAVIYTRDGSRRHVLPSELREELLHHLASGSEARVELDLVAVEAEEVLVWQDWERPAAISADARVVVTEEEHVLWFPEFNGLNAAPIFRTRMGWETLQLCTWDMHAEHLLLSLVPFSPAHRVVAEGIPERDGLHMSHDCMEDLAAHGILVRARASMIRPSGKLLGMSTHDVINSVANLH